MRVRGIIVIAWFMLVTVLMIGGCISLAYDRNGPWGLIALIAGNVMLWAIDMWIKYP